MLTIKMLLEHVEIRKENQLTVAKLYNTDIVLFNKKSIILNAISPTGIEWYTWTTKRSMNLLAAYYGLNFSVYQRAFKWYVNYDRKEYEYTDYMTIDRRQ